jgi:hypothetical protein
MSEPMTGATLKTTLGALGLPPSWFADKMGVTMRTVVRWFDSDTVSEKVAGELEKLSEQTLAAMRETVGSITPNDGNPVVLHTYRTDADTPNGMPASWHRALTFRLMEHFRQQGKTVEVQYHA